MAMSVGSEDGEAGVMAEINTTPLVDIMLVLLIIFLITVPVIKKMAAVEIPKAVNIPTRPSPRTSPFRWIRAARSTGMPHR